MGARGPKPTPKNVLKFRGSWRGNLADDGDVKPDVEIPGCPKHLLPEARKEWRRITPLLQDLGLVSMIDRTALALYCQEWAWWVWHDQAFQRDIRLAEQRRAAFEAAEQCKADAAETRGEGYTPKTWAGGDGLQIETPNGNLTYNPHWVARNKAGEKLDKYLASFGLSPSSRGRVTPGNRTGYLPGMEPAKGGVDEL